MDETQQNTNRPTVKLPGYELIDLLGTGGYGEVWRAIAPGGLTKAVKFVFGQYNEKRAANELKSLQKVKEVRHPFLLSLERIEVLEDRLVIITEVADESLKDRYERCRSEGLPGIPREELLGYMRDTADALDFLSHQHSLQHLDVKPENLLLLAGHVKVADFGLVKELQNTQASLVGGLTPLYAAPEVFQGCPSKHSDQYSLAVLFQEMLTGRLPFNGASAAELTLQHLNDEPDLSSLPDSDRYVLARALSKNIDRRYENCSDFVKALCADKSEWQIARETSSEVQNAPSVSRSETMSCAPITPRPGPVTQVFDRSIADDESEQSLELSKSMELPRPDLSEAVIRELPALDFDQSGEESAEDLRPTLVVGLGGVGARVLSQLRQQITRRHGAEQLMPAVQLLAIDTTSRGMLADMKAAQGETLTSEEMLALPLRRPQEYRDRADRIQSWLSRRWLYNIPRSLETEGLRPLGRLAFVDHAKRTIQRIRMSLSAAMESAATEQTGEAVGLAFQPQAARVIVVGSISGGTGSGMSLDMGYAVREVCKRLGIENAETVGVFTHSLGQEARQRELAKVNAFSWATELHHFQHSSGGYPGDEAASLPGSAVGVAPFDQTYLLRLEDGQTESELRNATESIAEYLYLRTLTPAARFAGLSHAADDSDDCETVRSFALQRMTGTDVKQARAWSESVARQVVLNWSGGLSGCASQRSWKPSSLAQDATQEREQESLNTDTNQLVQGATQLIVQLQLNLEGLAATTRDAVKARFDGRVDRFYLKTLATVEEAGGELDTLGALKIADELFSDVNIRNINSSVQILGDPLDRVVGPFGLKIARDLRQWLLEKLDDRQERLPGSTAAATWLSDHFEAVARDADRLAVRLAAEMQDAATAIRQSVGKRRESKFTEVVLQKLLSYLKLRHDHASVLGVRYLAGTLHSEMKGMLENFVELRRHLNHVAESLAHQDEDASDLYSGSQTAVTLEEPSEVMLDAEQASIVMDLATQVDEVVQEEFICDHGGLFETVMSNTRVRAGLLATIRQRSGELVEQHLREDSLAQQLGDVSEAAFATVAGEARPKLLQYGGDLRRMTVLPSSFGEANERLARLPFAKETTVVVSEHADLCVCGEAARLPIMPLAVDMIDARRDYAEFASRVHTRRDIDWLPLVELGAAPEPVNWDSGDYGDRSSVSATALV